MSEATTHSITRRPGRFTWFSVGLVAATALGTTWFGSASQAADDELATMFVPITPCRLADTRPDTQVGSRGTPIGEDQIFVQAVTGSHGNCTIPTNAAGIALNVTASNPTARSFLTVFPADAARPLSANLNYVANATPAPNKVDVALSSDGKIGLYNRFGSVHVVIDVTGYYIDGLAELESALATKADRSSTYTKNEVNALLGEAGYTDAEIDTLLDDKADADAVYSKAEVDDLLAAAGLGYSDAEIDAFLADKADAADVYTDDEVDALLDDKADQTTTYTKTEVDDLLTTHGYTNAQIDTLLGDKADADTVYTQAEVDALLDDKADQTTTYTKTEVDDLLAAAGSGYSDAEIDTLLGLKANSTDVYTQAQVDALLAGKADQATTYTEAEVDANFLGRDLEIVMRQNTNTLSGLLGLLSIDLLGVEIAAGNTGLMELVGPAAISDAIGGTVDYRLDVLEICIDDLVDLAVVDTLSVSVRDELSILETVDLIDGFDLDTAGCYSIDASALADGDGYALQIGVAGGLLDTLDVVSIESTWVPVTP